jgi:hypothetical protein
MINGLYYIVVSLLKTRIVKSAETSVARKRPCKHSRCYAMAATDTHATIQEMLEAVLSARSVQRLYNEDQLRDGHHPRVHILLRSES